MIDIEKLNKDQLRIVDKIEREATAQGLDPRFALAIANIETNGKFQHFDGKKVLTGTSGELGVMQLMPKTAKGLGVDPLDEDQNIRGGVTLLKQLMDQHKDPLKAAVGYNASVPSRNKFYKSGDLNDLPPATLLYVDKLEKLYPLEEMMKSPTEAAAEPPVEAPAEAVEPSTLPEVSSELPASLTEPTPEPLLVDPKTGALVGAGVGFTAGTVESGVNYLTGRRQRLAEEARRLAEAADTRSPGQKYSSKTGFGRGEGYTVREVSDEFKQAREKAQARGKVSEKVQRLYGGEAVKKGLLNIEGWAREQQILRELADKARLRQAAEATAKVAGKIPFGSTLAGVGAGLDVAEAAKRYQEGDVGGAAISGISALGQAAMLAPHPVPRLGGALATAAAMPADYVYQVMRENERRKKKGLPPITKPVEEIQYDPMGNPIR
jgi:hypothetical protein